MRFVSVATACVALAIACSSSDENGSSSSGGSSGGSSGNSSSGDGGGSSSGTSGGDGSVEPSGPPAIRFVGRFDERDNEGPLCGWPGCRIIARFEGTAISAKLE